MGPGPSCSSWFARGSTNGWEVVSPDHVLRGTAVELRESIVGVDFSRKTPRQRTLEFVVRIGCRPLRVLVDLGLIGNYIDVQECVVRGIKVEAEDQAKELKMADSTMVRIEGRVRFMLKCGGYRCEISARVFPNMNKQMIIGIPWLSKENPHIDCTQGVVVIKKGQNWISLSLANS